MLPNGASIVQGGPAGETVLVQGRVFGADGKPLEGAIVNVWETAPNGLYEQQDPDQPDFNLRGQFRSDKDGRYAFRAWKAEADLAPGPHALRVRATGNDGGTQPMEPRWNPAGYMRNVVETTRVRAA